VSRQAATLIFAATLANLVSLAVVATVYSTVYNDGYYRGFQEGWEHQHRVGCMTDEEIDYWNTPYELRPYRNLPPEYWRTPPPRDLRLTDARP